MASEALDRACQQLGKTQEFQHERSTARAVELARIDVVLAQLYIDEILAFFESLQPGELDRITGFVKAIVILATADRAYLQALAKRAELHSLSELRAEYTQQFDEFESALALLGAVVLNPDNVVFSEDTSSTEVDGDDEVASDTPSASIIMRQDNGGALTDLVRIAQGKGDKESLLHCITFLRNALTDFTREIKFACHLWELAQ